VDEDEDVETLGYNDDDDDNDNVYVCCLPMRIDQSCLFVIIHSVAYKKSKNLTSIRSVKQTQQEENKKNKKKKNQRHWPLASTKQLARPSRMNYYYFVFLHAHSF
jgi:hypothetical protein